MNNIRVLLVEDHTLVRAGFRVLLEKIEGILVIGEVSDGRSATKLAKELDPDVVLMDIAMAGMNNIKGFAVRILLKDADRNELELAIKAVWRGETYLTPSMTKFAVDAYCQQGEAQTGPLARLTGRQREILQLIAEGCSTKQIAQRLDLSVKTVETHRAQLMERLDIHDVPGLVRLAIRTGLVQSD